MISNCYDISERKYTFKVRHGETMCPFIRCLASKHGIQELKLGAPREAHKRYDLLKSNPKHYSRNPMVTWNGKQQKARAKLDERVSFLNFSCFSRNRGVLSLVKVSINLRMKERPSFYVNYEASTSSPSSSCNKGQKAHSDLSITVGERFRSCSDKQEAEKVFKLQTVAAELV